MLSGNIEWYKAILESNNLTQKKGIDYHSISGSFWFKTISKSLEKQFS